MLLDEIVSYWDRRADGYSDSIHEEMDSEVHQEFERHLQAALPDKGELNCLDIGCGPGFFSMLLAAQGHHVTAVDYSEEMLEFAHRNCAEKGLVIQKVRADAQKLPFQDGSADFICTRNLVWNLEDPERAYKEWLRVLRPGGRLFLYDGNYYLHYYNPEYQRARKAIFAVTKTQHHTMKGVDPAPIDEIARKLPLSRELRPEWDQRVLKNLGYKIIRTEPYFRTYMDEITREEKKLIYSFIVVAEKDAESRR